MPLDKKKQVREILSKLLTITEGKLWCDKTQLDKAIMECRGCDKRTLKNWWDFFWKLDYISQPYPDRYQLNTKRLLELELEVTETNQTHLFSGEHTHTQFSTHGEG